MLLVSLVCLQLVVFALGIPSTVPGQPSFVSARTLAKLASTVPRWCQTDPYSADITATEMVRTGPEFKVYHNIWYHNGKWYALGEGSVNASIEEGVTVNTGLIKMPIGNLSDMTTTLRTCFIKGVTLMVDFPFPAFPDNIGHFAEVMLPTFSVLHQGEFRQLVAGATPDTHIGVDTVLLVNLRKPLYDWFNEVMAITMSGPAPPGRDSQHYQLVDQVELEGFDKLGWLVFENLLVVQDRYTHPQRLSGFIAPDHGDMWRHDGCARYVSAKWKVGFLAPDIAGEFRRRMYRRHGIELPGGDSWTPGTPPALPRQITLMVYAEDHPQLTNGGDVYKMLLDVAQQIGWEVRVATMTMECPFLSHLDTVSQTGLLVGRHGPLLANSIFLPPGAAVMELLPYKWEWQKISQLYFNITQSMDMLHHFAWRPLDHKWCAYKEPSDIRYHTWTPDECSSRECLVVHARAGLMVDVEAVRAKLLEKMPHVLAGRSVEALRDDFPKAS